MSSTATAKIPKTFSEIAAATPPERERVVDFLRALSICCVVIGHWLIANITQDETGNIVGKNALEDIPYGWALTWVFQVMPIYFFVGGYANYVGIRSCKRKGMSYPEFLTSRVRRLMKPVIALLCVWVPINFFIDWQNFRSEEFAEVLSRIITQPLWFIGVYILVTALSWPLFNLHLKWGAKFIIISAIAPPLIDWLRFGRDIEAVGYLNIFIWIWVHQLGFAYADGTLLASAAKKDSSNVTQIWKKFGGAFITFVGAAGLFLCSGIKKVDHITFFHDLAVTLHVDDLPYPSSMVGMPKEISNMNPPTAAIFFLALTQIGLVIVLRDRLQKILQGRRMWTFTVMINSMILTIFCWHQTSLALVTLVRVNLGINEPEIGTTTWWATRPLLLGCYAIVLTCIVPIFWKYERWRNDDMTGINSKSVTICSVIVLVIGLMGLALGGIDNMFGEGSDLMGLFQINAFLSIVLTFCGAGAFGVMRNMKKVAQGELSPVDLKS